MTREELKNIWRALFRATPPNDAQWLLWERMHDPETIQAAILQTAVKQRSLGGVMDAEYQIKFCSSVANRLRKEKQHALAQLKAATVPVKHVTAVAVPDDDDSRWNR